MHAQVFCRRCLNIEADRDGAYLAAPTPGMYVSGKPSADHMTAPRTGLYRSQSQLTWRPILRYFGRVSWFLFVFPVFDFVASEILIMYSIAVLRYIPTWTFPPRLYRWSILPRIDSTPLALVP